MAGLFTQGNLYFSINLLIYCLVLLPLYNCCALDVNSLKHKSKDLKHKLQGTRGRHQDILREKVKNVNEASSFLKETKSRVHAPKKELVDKTGEKRDNFVTIPEPLPVNRFVQEPFLDHHVSYVPQPYPVTHVEFVAKPIAVPVEVPNQVKVQHFHVHKDRKLSASFLRGFQSFSRMGHEEKGC